MCQSVDVFSEIIFPLFTENSGNRSEKPIIDDKKPGMKIRREAQYIPVNAKKEFPGKKPLLQLSLIMNVKFLILLVDKNKPIREILHIIAIMRYEPKIFVKNMVMKRSTTCIIEIARSKYIIITALESFKIFRMNWILNIGLPQESLKTL